MHGGGYYVFIVSRCPDICPDVPCQHRIFFSSHTNTSSRMRFMRHNWSATKQRLHPQSVAEISRHSFLSGDLQDSTMRYIVWVSPQGHTSVPVFQLRFKYDSIAIRAQRVITRTRFFVRSHTSSIRAPYENRVEACHIAHGLFKIHDGGDPPSWILMPKCKNAIFSKTKQFRSMSSINDL